MSSSIQFGSRVPSLSDRLQFYLGGNKLGSQTLKAAVELRCLAERNSTIRDSLLPLIYSLDTLRKEASTDTEISRQYEKKLLTLLEEVFSGRLPRVIPLVRGDITSRTPSIHFPFLCKARPAKGYELGVILKCMNQSRHWGLCELAMELGQKPFSHRKDLAVWRGATTGADQDHPASRFSFVCKYFAMTSFVDAGFSCVCQERTNYQCYVRGPLRLREMIDYKYIISLPGNDKDSGLSWKLASGSVVIMPRPTVHSWLAEIFLIPGYHYLQLNDDLANLEELLIWCSENNDACEAIAQNALDYVKQFADPLLERTIERTVVQCFFSRLDHDL